MAHFARLKPKTIIPAVVIAAESSASARIASRGIPKLWCMTINKTAAVIAAVVANMNRLTILVSIGSFPTREPLPAEYEQAARGLIIHLDEAGDYSRQWATHSAAWFKLAVAADLELAVQFCVRVLIVGLLPFRLVARSNVAGRALG